MLLLYKRSCVIMKDIKPRDCMTKQQAQFEQTVGDYFDTCDFDDSDLLIVPGTNDRSADTLKSWADFIVRRFPDERQTVIEYPATVGPLVGGVRAHRYDESKEIATRRTRESLARAAGRIVLVGYSQGADAAWEGATQAVEAGEITPEDLQVILLGHPQRPGGIKDAMSRRHRITSRLFGTAFKAEMNGAWEIDPRITVTSVAVEGDPITSFPQPGPHPLRFVSSFAAGYFMIHGGMGYESAAQLEKLSVAHVETIPGTSTTYLDAAAADPKEQARAYPKQWLQARHAAQAAALASRPLIGT